MPAAPLPENETERLRALRELDVLDSAPEEAFDEIVRLASLICGTPIAAISLVDEARQWFKAKLGVEATETPRDMSFCAHAMLKPKEMLVVPDARNDARFASNALVLENPNIRFYAGAPLITTDGIALGALCVIAPRARRGLTKEQRTAMGWLARQVITQLELRKALLQRDHEVKARKRVVQALRQSEERLNEAQHTARLGSWEFDVRTGAIQWSREMFNLLDWSHRSAPPTYEENCAIYDPQDAVALQNCVRCAINAGTPYALDLRRITQDGSVRWYHAIGNPVIEHGETVRLVGTLMDITERKALAERLEALNAQLREAANTDALTGLSNRRFGSARLTEEWDRCQRHDHSLSVLLLDIDRFKQINDTLGHAAGDATLIRVAQGLRDSLRSYSLVARWGGEEFLVLLPETNADGARQVGERVRQMIASQVGSERSGPSVTVSIGVATRNEQTGTPEALVACADKALYLAKGAGRNRVVHADTGSL